MNISKVFEIEVSSLPTKENGYTAIVKAHMSTEQSSFTDIGISNAAQAGTDDHDAIIEDARKKAIARVSDSAPYEDIFTAPQAVHPISHNTSLYHEPQEGTSKYNHSKGKHMSDSQSRLLHNLSKEKGVDLNALSLKECNKNISDLSSYDANSLIQAIKSL